MTAPGDVVRLPGEHGGLYRVKEVRPNGDVTCFGGPHRQWRTFTPGALRPATPKEARAFERIGEQEADLRRAIRPARALRLTKGASS